MNLEGYTLLVGSGEWSALYDRGGRLVTYGDHSNVDEKIYSLGGILVDETDAFVKKPDPATKGHPRETAFGTLEEVTTAVALANDRTYRAEQMLEQAEALKRQAEELMKP